MPILKHALTGIAGLGFVVGLIAVARADAFDCKPTETQAECFTRLKCKTGEEVTDCQKRLRAAAAANGGNNGGGNNSSGNNGGGNNSSGNDRGGGDRGGNDRGGGDNDRGGNDRGGGDNDRGGDDRGGRRGGGGGDDRGRRRRGGGGGDNGGFEANKTFGLGLELGEPTGLNGKYFFGPKTALDFGIGYIYRQYYYGDGLHLYGDVLFHPVLLSQGPTVAIPFYVGVGLRYWQFDYYYPPTRVYYRGDAIGIRVPLGISFDFNNSPIDIFLQLVPTIDFLGGDYYDRFRDRNHFGVDFSAGVRFWFK